jgi:CRISPR-associated exonuclease Cas4
MAGDFKITGSYVQAFMICSRQVWLMSRQICPDEDNEFLEIGRLIGNNSYGRERKEIRLGHLCIDLVRRDKTDLVIAEVKKSSKAREAALMQLAFYLHELREMGIEAEGELLFPEERRKERVVLDSDLEQKINEVLKHIELIIKEDLPPVPERIPFCSNCAYAQLCWA